MKRVVEEVECEWEFDDRRFNLCCLALIDGEELVWYEKDERFRGLVRKTLRRLEDGVTFLVEDPTTRVVLTVGTLPLPKAPLSRESVNWAGIAEYLGFSSEQIEKVKALKLPPSE